MQDYSNYQTLASQVLGGKFSDVMLLVTAFTHRSYLNEHKKTVKEHNERLEFLGDAVLELVVTEYLYRNYTEPEGILTNWRSALVRTESISAAGERLGFNDYLRLSRGEKRGSDRARQQILANCYEAVIGAIYLDQGYDAASTFISNSLLTTFETILATGSWMDPKSRLQEIAQSVDNATPQYKVLSEEGPDHEKLFTVGVFVDSQLKGQGAGPSKQAAQQQAAELALASYTNKTPEPKS
ncbi:MAG TPA: ribonuclease III [Candidatus Saccharibacteria bacterium]|nr:ribonuclease III [Candidatus Saccharibacteria bacterium]HPR10292.1 ribonuclease III [Candidatus Saccharibacteria bacterium]